MATTETQALTMTLLAESSTDLFSGLRAVIERSADQMLSATMYGRPLETYGPYVDYYDFEDAKPEIWIDRVREATRTIQSVVDACSSYPFKVTHSDYTQLYRPQGDQSSLLQKYMRPIFVNNDRKNNPEQIPFSAFEIRLYMSIINGADPGAYLQEITENLTSAMSQNPLATWEGMVAFGLDLVLPGLPKMSIAQCDHLSEALEAWDNQQQHASNGIEFFVHTLQDAGVITLGNNESTHEYWIRGSQVLPGLQDYIDYGLTETGLQSPEYYMQIVLALSYFGLHRRLQFHEDNETIAALAVRRSDGKILAAAVNEADSEGGYLHAEEIVINKIQEQNQGDDTDFSDIDIYVSCEPCDEKCGKKIRKLKNLHGLYTGPRTNEGSDTISGLFTQEEPYEDVADATQFSPIPHVVQFGLFEEQFTQLFEDRLKWNEFVRKTTQTSVSG